MRKTSKAKERPSSLFKDRPEVNRRVKTELFSEGKSEYYLQTQIAHEKIKIERDTVLKILVKCKEQILGHIDIFQSFQEKKILSTASLEKVTQHFFFLRSKFFRYEQTSHQQSILNLRSLLKAIELLLFSINQTKNIMKSQGYIFVRQQQEFCQFFKYLLGKDCPLFHKKHLRKLLQQIWNYTIFYQKHHERVFQTLNLWSHGISIPLNPARSYIHKAVISQDAQFIKKACQFKLKSPIYCHINEADTNGITPLMLAIYLQKQKILSALLLQHADPFLVPLTCMSNPKKSFQQISQQIEMIRGPLKLIRIPLYECYNQNVIQFCRDNNIQLLAKLLALNTSRQFYSLKINKDLVDSLEKIPDCTFKISWKQQAKLFGEAYNDIIKVYKKRASIRFDFSIMGVIDKNIKRGKYSLVFKGKPDIQYYWVDYDLKKITNLIKELDVKQLQQKTIRIMKDTIIGRQTLTECLVQQNNIKNTKGSYKQTILNLTFQKLNIKKDGISKQNFKKYEDSLVNSKVVDYSKLTHSQVRYSLQQYIPATYPQPTRKKTQQKVKLQINTLPFFQLSMDHLLTIGSILRYFSPHFNKLIQILKWQRMLEQICSKGIFKQFPSKVIAEIKGIHLTILFENFDFNPMIKNQAFELLSALEQQSFDCVLPKGTSFVYSEHKSIEQSFLSSVTKFLKGEEQDFQFGEACQRYQKLLDNIQDQQDYTCEVNQQNQQDKNLNAFSKNKSPHK